MSDSEPRTARRAQGAPKVRLGAARPNYYIYYFFQYNTYIMFSKLKSALLFAVLFGLFAYMGISCGAPAAPKMQALADSLATAELVPYKGKNGKWGLSTLSHQVVLPCEYEDIEVLQEQPNMILIKQNGYWYGFDRKGNVIIAEGYKDIFLYDNYWYLAKKENGAKVMRDASGKRTIAEGYTYYSAHADWIVAKNETGDKANIFDTTGKQLSKEKYMSAFKPHEYYSHGLVTLDNKKYAIFSAEKGRLTDYNFNATQAGSSDYIIVKSGDTEDKYSNYSGEILNPADSAGDYKSYIVFDSLLLPIHTSFTNPPDSFITSKGISHTKQNYMFTYKHIKDNILFIPDGIVFSVDNGKTYHFVLEYYLNINAVAKYALTTEEFAAVYTPIDVYKGQYIVLKDGKFGVWSAKTKQMLVPAEYTKIHHLQPAIFMSFDMQQKYLYQNRLILTNDKDGVLFDPKNETSQNISGFDVPSNNMDVRNIFADYLFIRDDSSKYYAIYSIKAGKILGKLNSPFSNVVNQTQKIFYLDSINGGMPLMQINPNNELVQLAIVPNLEDNSINFAWDSGIIGKKNRESYDIDWYNFEGKKIQSMDGDKCEVNDYGVIENGAIIYNTKLEKVDYKPKGKIYAMGKVIKDIFKADMNKDTKSEWLYLDWSGKRYAEQ